MATIGGVVDYTLMHTLTQYSHHNRTAGDFGLLRSEIHVRSYIPFQNAKLPNSWWRVKTAKWLFWISIASAVYHYAREHCFQPFYSW